VYSSLMWLCEWLLKVVVLRGNTLFCQTQLDKNT
jgi:hypothetical protein